MGMIRSSIAVVDQGSGGGVAGADEQNYDEWEDDITEPIPAGFRIPVQDLAIVETTGGHHRVSIDLTDQGFIPAAVIVQEGVRTEWVINNLSTREENFAVRFPAYGQELPFDSGENTILLLPQGDFEFSTSDSEYYGFVKVVADINTMDIDSIKSEISGYETMMYPSSYFGSPGGMECH
jgi:hypothetical protein